MSRARPCRAERRATNICCADLTTGQLLFCRDAEADHAFRRDSQLRAADLRPFLERTRAIKRETLARPDGD